MFLTFVFSFKCYVEFSAMYLENQEKNGSVCVEIDRNNPLSCYNKNNVPQVENNSTETPLSKIFPLEHSESVISELYRNQYLISEDNSSTKENKLLIKCDKEYMSNCRKKLKVAKERIISDKDIEAGRVLFRSKMDSISRNGMVCLNIKGEVKFTPYKNNSRYHEAGRKNMIGRMYHRYKRMSTSNQGVLLTLTYDPSKIDVWDAWGNVGNDCRCFMKNLNKTRKSYYKKEKRKVPRLSYFRVVEAHKNSFPHVHYYFPNLKWLWHHSKGKRGTKKNSYGGDINGVFEIWGHGRTEVKLARGGGKVANYVTKYLRKFDLDNEDAMMFMWLNGTRLFSFSRDFSGDCNEFEEKVTHFMFGSCNFRDFSKLLYKIDSRVFIDSIDGGCGGGDPS